MDSKKSNKIRDIVRLQQILKKWKKLANANANADTNANENSPKTSSKSNGNGNSNKGIKFLKRTLSFTDVNGGSVASASASDANVIPKGYLAVCVGKELKRFIIPTDYLTHRAFAILLRQAEEEFGFQQEGVLQIPCQVSVFEKILKMVQLNEEDFLFQNHSDSVENEMSGFYCSPEQTSHSHHTQMCT